MSPGRGCTSCSRLQHSDMLKTPQWGGGAPEHTLLFQKKPSDSVLSVFLHQGTGLNKFPEPSSTSRSQGSCGQSGLSHDCVIPGISGTRMVAIFNTKDANLETLM